MKQRPYFFEIFAVANFIVIQALLWPMPAPLLTLPRALWTVMLAFLVQAAIGVVIRALIARWRHDLPAYIAIIRSPGWIVDTLRLAIASALFIHAYGWIKLAIPLLHPRLFDQELWDLDAKLLAGHSPNEFFLALFSEPPMLRAIDWSYANIFFASLVIATLIFGSAPSRDVRVAFMNSNVVLWLAGAWLYVAVPSLGPAFAFPAVWQPLSALLDRTQTLQRLLMTNYHNLMLLAHGVRRPINLFFGVAAFPSLHVAFQMLLFLWTRRVWRAGQVIFGVFVVAILLGSMVTGWHYLIDGVAGIALACLCYWLFAIRFAPKTF